jgi:hypothetical protein
LGLVVALMASEVPRIVGIKTPAAGIFLEETP